MAKPAANLYVFPADMGPINKHVHSRFSSNSDRESKAWTKDAHCHKLEEGCRRMVVAGIVFLREQTHNTDLCLEPRMHQRIFGPIPRGASHTLHDRLTTCLSHAAGSSREGITDAIDALRAIADKGFAVWVNSHRPYNAPALVERPRIKGRDLHKATRKPLKGSNSKKNRKGPSGKGYGE